MTDALCTLLTGLLFGAAYGYTYACEHLKARPRLD